MNNHTPGPWVYDCGAIYAQCQLNKRGMTREAPIAEVLDGRPDAYKANGRLIVAAPELLEALSEMTELAAGHVGGVTVAAKREILAKAHAAIAKATGA